MEYKKYNDISFEKVNKVFSLKTNDIAMRLQLFKKVKKEKQKKTKKFVNEKNRGINGV